MHYLQRTNKLESPRAGRYRKKHIDKKIIIIIILMDIDNYPKEIIHISITALDVLYYYLITNF